jgi:hypothetical protein
MRNIPMRGENTITIITRSKWRKFISNEPIRAQVNYKVFPELNSRKLE